jgi:hypothetical protein
MQQIHNQNGGVVIRIVLITVTLVLVAVAIFWFLQKGQEEQERLDRKAVEIGEYGLLMALDKIRTIPSWCEPIGKTEYENGWYEVNVDRKVTHDTTFLFVESLGHMGALTKKQECILRLEVNGPDSAWVRQTIR